MLDTALGGAKLLYKFTPLAKQVKVVQKSLNRVLGDTKLTLNEMFTLVAEIGNLLKDRPRSTKPNDRSGTDYLFLNSLLLGRCFQGGGVFTLLIRQKWHVDRKNLVVGDICLLKDQNAYRGE